MTISARENRGTGQWAQFVALRATGDSLEVIRDDPEVVPLMEAVLSGDAATRAGASAGLIRLGEPAVGPLMRLLRYGKPESRELASQALAGIGAPALTPVAGALGHWNWEVRYQAAVCLGDSGLEEAVPPLLGALRDPNGCVRWGAAGALVKIGSAAVPLLLEALPEADALHGELIALLGRIGDPLALPRLAAEATDRSAPARAEAVEALGAMGDPRAVLPLCEVLLRSDAALRLRAVNALARLPHPRAVPALALALSDEVREVRLAAIGALAAIPGAGPAALAGSLPAVDSEVRQRALHALGRAATASLVPALIRMLRHRERSARIAAAEALAGITERDPVVSLRAALPLLRRLLASPLGTDAEARQAYEGLIGRIERATARFKDLPAPGEGSAPAAHLPVPGELPASG